MMESEWRFPKGSPPASRQDWLIPVNEDGVHSAREMVTIYLDRGMWGMRPGAKYCRWIKQGDQVCFNAMKSGVVAIAVATGRAQDTIKEDEWPERNPYDAKIYKLPLDRDTVVYCYGIGLGKEQVERLDSYKQKGSGKTHCAFLHTPQPISPEDFAFICGKQAGAGED